MDILKKIRIDGIDYDIGASIEPADYTNLGGIIIGTGLHIDAYGKTEVYISQDNGLIFMDEYDHHNNRTISALAIDTAWLIEFIKNNLDLNCGSGSCDDTTSAALYLDIVNNSIITDVLLRRDSSIVFSKNLIPNNAYLGTITDCTREDILLLTIDTALYAEDCIDSIYLSISDKNGRTIDEGSLLQWKSKYYIDTEKDPVTLGSSFVIHLGSFFDDYYNTLSRLTISDTGVEYTTTTTTTKEPDTIHRDMAFDLIIDNDYIACYNNTEYSDPCIDYVYVGTNTDGFYFQSNNTANESHCLTIPKLVGNIHNDKRYIIISMLPEIPIEFAKEFIYIKEDYRYRRLGDLGINAKEYNSGYVYLSSNSSGSSRDYIAIDIEDIILKDLFLDNNSKVELGIAGVCTRDTDVDITIERWGSGDYISNNLIDVISLGTLYPESSDSVYIVNKNSDGDIIFKENVMLKRFLNLYNTYQYQHINIAVQNNIPIDKIDEVINISIYDNGDNILGTCPLKSTKIPYYVNTSEYSPIQYGDNYRNRYVNIKLMDIIQTYDLTKDIHIKFCAFGDYEEESNLLCDTCEHVMK